jgi:hypothetical protein
MRYLVACAFWAVVVSTGPANAQVGGQIQQVSETKMSAAASEWLGRAESGDLIPAWNVKEPPRGIPPAYRIAPPVVKEGRTRCQFHSEKERRALLTCLEVFGVYHRADTPRAGEVLPPPVYVPPLRRPPTAIIVVK